jgi:hypothetical protein
MNRLVGVGAVPLLLTAVIGVTVYGGTGSTHAEPHHSGQDRH